MIGALLPGCAESTRLFQTTLYMTRDSVSRFVTPPETQITTPWMPCSIKIGWCGNYRKLWLGLKTPTITTACPVRVRRLKRMSKTMCSASPSPYIHHSQPAKTCFREKGGVHEWFRYDISTRPNPDHIFFLFFKHFFQNRNTRTVPSVLVILKCKTASQPPIPESTIAPTSGH
jgi:hypothetical protein